jgi:hypothetical protein
MLFVAEDAAQTYLTLGWSDADGPLRDCGRGNTHAFFFYVEQRRVLASGTPTRSLSLIFFFPQQ